MLDCPRCGNALPLTAPACACGAVPPLDGVGLVCGACAAWNAPFRAACAACGAALGPSAQRLRVVVAASGSGVAVPPGASIVCGRGDADLVVPGVTVSRRHARFSADAGGLRVEDLGSLNGTWIRLPRGRALAPGDELFSRGRRLRRVAQGGFEAYEANGARTWELPDAALDEARTWLRISAPERVAAGDEVLLGAERLRVEG